MNHRIILGSIATIASLAACGPQPSLTNDAAADSASVSDASADADSGASAVRWTPCTLFADGTGPAAECGVMNVPLDRAQPSGPTIEYYFKRYRPQGGRSLRALWMLQGGPGASGNVFEGFSEALATRFADVDYYMPDHRGTGRSSRLGCPAQEAETSEGAQAITAAEWPACLASVRAQYGSRLAAFSTTNAANDLRLAIDATRVQGQPVFVLGISYGTYLAHRYLQLAPAHADGVILDSMVTPGDSLFYQDADSDEAARDYLAACARDAFCRSKLGDDPWSKAVSLVARLKSGHCAQVAVDGVSTHVIVRRAFAGLMMNPNLRGYLAPILYRFDRCSAADLPALRTLMAQLTQAQPLDLEMQLWGWVLMNNVALSEFDTDATLTAARLEAIREGAVASRDVTEMLAINRGAWPTYAPDEFTGRLATTATPMLMLQGGLDPATLLRKARPMQMHFNGPNQHWVEFAQASHTTLSSTPFVDEAGERRSCGTRLLMRFIEAPTQPLDTSCAARVEGVDFRNDRPDINRALFGRADAWE